MELRGADGTLQHNLPYYPCYVKDSALKCGSISRSQYVEEQRTTPTYAVVSGAPGELVVVGLGLRGPDREITRSFTIIDRIKTGLPTDFTCLALSPDTTWLVAGGADGSPIVFVRLNVARLMVHWEHSVINPQGQRAYTVYSDVRNTWAGMTACAFSPDSNLVYATHTDNTFRVWDVHNRRELSD